jgi:hypothetical protein
MRVLTTGIAMLVILLAFTLIPALAGEGPDEIESNNTMELADSIDGLVIEGNMDEDDGDDWFVLNGQEGYHPTFTIFFDEDEVEVDFAIYSGEEEVAEAIGYGTDESVTADVPDRCYIHVWWWSGEGDYTIRIEPGKDECEGEDEIEPNNDKEDADLIEGLEINGYICEDDGDWFVLDGQEGFNPTFTIYFDDEECEIDFEVYSGDELVGGAYDYGSDESITCDVPGVCYVYVYYWSGEGEYTIEIEP